MISRLYHWFGTVLLLLLALTASPVRAETDPSVAHLRCIMQRLGLSLDWNDRDGMQANLVRDESPRVKGVTDSEVSADIGKQFIDDKKPYILVKRQLEAGEQVIEYGRTNNSFQKLFPGKKPRHFAGKVVLDIGCGGGKSVQQLRDAGVEAYGIDLVIDPAKKEFGYFFERDALNTGFPDNSVDVVVSMLSVFTYEAKDKALMGKAFAELERILKPGGKIYLRGGHPMELVEQLPGFRVLENHSGNAILEKVQ